jgi:AcrR family transcriptional regulator
MSSIDIATLKPCMRSARLWLGFIGEAGGRHYRTRDQLVSACVQRLIELDLLEIDIARVAERAMSPEQLADLGGDLMWHWITVDAHRHLARYELLLHSRRRPDLAADLVAAGEKLRSAMATVLDTQGCPLPAQTSVWFVGCVDGVVMDQLTGRGAQRPMSRSDLRDFAKFLVRADGR